MADAAARPNAGRALYICYFGLREPLVQNQVLPYLRGLTRAGFDITLLTFDRDRDDHDALKNRLREEGIEWRSRRYHSRPPGLAKIYDLVSGVISTCRIVRERDIQIVHGRSHLPTAIGAIAKWITGCRLVFDIRGLLADEYVDAEHWTRDGLFYRITKWAENRLLAYADGFVVLTERAKEHLFMADHAGHRPVEVIPCCVDLEKFGSFSTAVVSELLQRHRLGGRRVLLYTGGVEGFYLPEQMADFFSHASRTRGIVPLILTRGDSSRLEERFVRNGLSKSDYRLLSAEPGEVPHYLALGDAAVSFIKPAFSKIASSPTKIAEYLAAGLPVLSNRGIGDLDQQLSEEIGVLLDGYSEDDYERGLEQLEKLIDDPETAAKCRRAANDLFALNGVADLLYSRLYGAVLRETERAGSPPVVGSAGD